MRDISRRDFLVMMQILMAGRFLTTITGTSLLGGILCSPAMAKPGGHLARAHYCASKYDIDGLGLVELNIGGTGFAALQTPQEVQDALASNMAFLEWETNQCFTRHPTLGVVAAVLREERPSPVLIRSNNSSGPLFPAILITDLFFNIEFPSINLTIFNKDPISFEGNAENLFDTRCLEPGGSYTLKAPVDFFNATNPEQHIATLLSTDLSVIPHSGLGVTLKSKKIVGDIVTTEWVIANLRSNPQEIIWYADDANYLKIISPRRGTPITIGKEPVAIAVEALITGPLDRRSCIFFGANSLSSTLEGFTSSLGMIDGEQLPSLCDADSDGDVNRNDINSIFILRNTAADPSDPLDPDSDCKITVNDARICTLHCTRPGCAL